jgi:hypothetical protein
VCGVRAANPLRREISKSADQFPPLQMMKNSFAPFPVWHAARLCSA